MLNINSIHTATSSLNQGTAVGRWNFQSGKTTTTVTGVLDALKENGLVRILAEPNLVCLNGQSADFLAGGQIPVPVSAGLGTTTIEWKDFGVGLKFTPTIVGDDRINLQVHPEVSQLDYTKSITIAGTTVPAISSRRTSTTVELRNGQSFAVAGMDRVDCPDLNFFVVSVKIQNETGGNLAEIVENIAFLIRERFKLKGRVRVLSAEGRMPTGTEAWTHTLRVAPPEEMPMSVAAASLASRLAVTAVETCPVVTSGSSGSCRLPARAAASTAFCSLFLAT